MFSSVSSALLWRGFLAIAIGVVSVVWPHITVGAFVILFAVYAFLAAVVMRPGHLAGTVPARWRDTSFLPCSRSPPD
jgi:predicted anti-sigma-YlaC factor YlaD